MMRPCAFVLSCLVWGCGSAPDDGAALDRLAGSMAFYASFEDGMDAAFARDDRRIYSAPSYDALANRGPWYWGEDVQIAYAAGIAGNGLSFRGGLTQAVFYAAGENTPWAGGGALSVWLRPDMLAGSPVSSAANDGTPALAVSLAPEPPSVAAAVFGRSGEAPLTTAADQWLHLAVSIATGADGPAATIYIDGVDRARFAAGDPATAWKPEGSTIRLGVGYVGLIDELATFDRALTFEEVQLLQRTPNLPASLMR